MRTTKDLFQEAAHACVDAIDRQSSDAFDHVATMIACCRIDSPNLAGMENDIAEEESRIRVLIGRGEIEQHHPESK